MADYAAAAGFIQFDPIEREANGQDIIDLTIKTPGTDGILIRVTVWPELQTDEVRSLGKGDWLAADGKLTVGEFEKDGETRTSVQISASKLAFIKGVEREEREVVNEKGSSKDLF